MATITTELSNSEYRKVAAISKSDLDLVAKSPALLEWRKACRSDAHSEVAEIGNALHCSVLEPERFASEYRKRPQFDMRTSVGKANAEAFDASAIGKLVLSYDKYEMIEAMRQSIYAHPLAALLLNAEGPCEASIFFDYLGQSCKCRPDKISVLNGDHYLVDVKTTDDVEKMAYSIRDYRYHVQAYFYSQGYKELTGIMPEFVFIFVGKNRVFGAHPVRVVRLNADYLIQAEQEIKANMEAYSEYLAFGVSLSHIEDIAPSRARY